MSKRSSITTTELQREYDRWHEKHGLTTVDPRFREFANWILDLLGGTRGESLLDVACGTGTFLSVARERGLALSGIDLSPSAIETARTIVPDAGLHVGEGESLPFADSTFDRVTCLGSLEHFPDPDAGAREIARVLRPGGRALVYVPNLFFLGHVWFGLRHGTQPSEGEQDFSETFRSSQGWRHLIEAAGLDVESLEVWNHIYASPKVSPLVMRAWNVVSPFVPRNAAYAFAFVCSKG